MKLPVNFSSELELESFLIDRYLSGLSLRDLEKEVDISRPTIASFLKKSNITIRNIPSIKLNQIQINKCLELYNNGSGPTIDSIASILAISNEQVGYALKKNNIKCNRSRLKGRRIFNFANKLSLSFSSLDELDKYIIEEYKTKTGQEIANNLGYKSHHSVTNKLKILGVKRRPQNARYKYQVNEGYFSQIDTWEKAYILGFITADGCLYIRGNGCSLNINLAYRDIFHLDYINKLMGSNYPLSEYINKEFNKKMVQLQIYHQGLTRDLLKWGINRAKSLIIEWQKDIPLNLMGAYLLGVFDGDGWWTSWINKKNNKKKLAFGLCSGSRIFLRECADFLSNIVGVTYRNSVYTTKRTTKYFQITYSSKNDCKLLYDYMYKDATIYLERKKIKAEEYLNYGQRS